MGHKIKYGAKFFLKIKFFPYLPTHFFWGHVTGNQHIIYFGLSGPSMDTPTSALNGVFFV